ncbi:tRNA preQ1(34) S-adenosylmethionine ribosyltransferase-isomerase QueA [Candidatus Arthromitus sp. SFB-rat-Yit]|uniref:tRNA preQ1(34) S-adenosylmethionine ribosyltransferase-isomerase QueA n=1 Tax=Candidatus Arthromitus sp. SFB-rat-Yit TaxID=1041504 RepID=UPI000227A16B|nr:tRNA preQ1(34) S-adenosylmethionine ribosyltransferase-isomerase QueA [Candidatus Arthromitus sp. SFB-rat-Yit]BAK81289.1 S-adenosylmethionine:tRNA ribosyltransferase-isomerase [Candidatus Arthromitus sp. SFB-rat-Yit]
MDIALFDFDLPERLIAQKPLKNRDASKLMVVDRKNGNIVHSEFVNVINYMNKDDVLVLNDTRVFPARIYGESSYGGKIEVLLVKNIEGKIWEVMCKPGKRALVGKKFHFINGKIEMEVIGINPDGNRIVNFTYDGEIYDILNKNGTIPLPPYIKDVLEDKEKYQTVYSNKIGSIAAPTAGLHFTNELLLKIRNKGVKIVYITLHVGLGTFLPVKTNDIDNHNMHSEYYEISNEAAEFINLAKSKGNKIVSVGTTTVRVLETVFSKNGKCVGEKGYTDIFIKPGYKFSAVDSLITNFHLPKSTLIILISAFYNREKILTAYEEAILNEYRFFSFGDSMIII